MADEEKDVSQTELGAAKFAAVGLTPEQEDLLEKLQKIKAATAPEVKRCPACGSDGHEHCRRPAHHGGASDARDSAARAN